MNSTFTRNGALGAHLGGGALFIDSGTVNICLVHSPTTQARMGMAYGGAIYNRLGTLKLRNSIVALNQAKAGPDIIGLVESQGYNLFSQDLE